MNPFYFCSLVLLAAFACGQDTDLNISEQVFEAEFNKLYATKEEEAKAAAALAASEKEINEENKLFKEGKASFYEKLNANSDMPKDQFEKELEGAIMPNDKNGRGLGAILPPEDEWYTHPELEKFYQDRQTPPASYDATKVALVTSVKNQMSCGSCAAFAATGAHETCMLKGGARFNGLDLSEQYLIDCGYNPNNYMNGCNGADSGTYGTFFATTLKGQSVHEATYPYLNTNPKLTCPTGKTIYNSGAYVATPLPDYDCTEAKLMSLVSTYGAAVSYIYASDSGFGNYASGVFDKCSSQSINHAILVVGYGTDAASGKNYWLVKNSWGTGWGAAGYIKIFRGNNQCGIGKFCYAAKCAKTSGTISDPPVVPPPPPIPASQTCDLNKTFGALTGSYVITWGTLTSYVTCSSGICRPTTAGPSNACMYICGQLTC